MFLLRYPVWIIKKAFLFSAYYTWCIAIFKKIVTFFLPFLKAGEVLYVVLKCSIFFLLDKVLYLWNRKWLLWYSASWLWNTHTTGAQLGQLFVSTLKMHSSLTHGPYSLHRYLIMSVLFGLFDVHLSECMILWQWQQGINKFHILLSSLVVAQEVCMKL